MDGGMRAAVLRRGSAPSSVLNKELANVKSSEVSEESGSRAQQSLLQRASQQSAASMGSAPDLSRERMSIINDMVMHRRTSIAEHNRMLETVDDGERKAEGPSGGGAGSVSAWGVGGGDEESKETELRVVPQPEGGPVAGDGPASDPSAGPGGEFTERLKDPARKASVVRRSVYWHQKGTDQSGCTVVLAQVLLWPGSPARSRWELVMAVAAVHSALSIPFEVAFRPDSAAYTAFALMNTAVFVADMLLRFCTVVIHTDGQLLTTHHDIAASIVVTPSFWCDVVANVVAPALVYSLRTRGLELLMVPRILRPRRMTSGLLTRFLEVKFLAPIRIVTQLLSFIVIAHWIGCFWYLLGDTETESENDPPWVFVNDIQAWSMVNRYAISVYWALLTMTTVGYGDVVPGTHAEYWYSMFVFIVGAAMTAVIFGNMTVLITTMDASNERYRSKIMEVGELTRFFNVPEQLARRVRDNVDYQWALSGGFDLEEALRSLPSSLRAEVAMSLYGEAVKQVPLFFGCEESLLTSLVLKLSLIVALPGEMVYKAGEVGQEASFVGGGQLEVLSADLTTVFATIGFGSLVGEGCLFGSPIRIANVRAITFCELFTITRDEFLAVLQHFPEIADRLNNKGRATMSQYKRNVRRNSADILPDDDPADPSEVDGTRTRSNSVVPEGSTPGKNKSFRAAARGVLAANLIGSNQKSTPSRQNSSNRNESAASAAALVAAARQASASSAADIAELTARSSSFTSAEEDEAGALVPFPRASSPGAAARQRRRMTDGDIPPSAIYPAPDPPPAGGFSPDWHRPRPAGEAEDRVSALERKVDGLGGKLDRVLAALDASSSGAPPQQGPVA